MPTLNRKVITRLLLFRQLFFVCYQLFGNIDMVKSYAIFRVQLQCKKLTGSI